MDNRTIMKSYPQSLKHRQKWANYKQLIILSSRTMNSEIIIYFLKNTLRGICDSQPHFYNCICYYYFWLIFLLELQRRNRKSRAFLWYACLAWGKSISRHEKSNCWELVTDCRETKTILQHYLLYECCCFQFIPTLHTVTEFLSTRLPSHLNLFIFLFMLRSTSNK